ncbi:MAG: hypothetical protein AMXMBFR66_00240 [Pseudomonadota bacterium]|nr:methyltransferase domain-containing protein [Rubrivivax sp.]NLZ42542.1 methyltransferase domain-containing protein [Comamonadaceae bacterium]
MVDDEREPPGAGAPPGNAPRRLDPVALRRLRQRLWRAGRAPWLHGEVARRMAERLPVIKLRPALIVDWWARLGDSAEWLDAAYPQARRLALEPDGAPALPREPRPAWWSPGRWRGGTRAARIEAVAQSLLTDGQADLVWANMVLHGADDPAATMRSWLRALAVDGFLMFSTLGPGSLPQLRALYAERGWPPPHAPFVDMHDLGDLLVATGFADPVMDQETITLTWPDADALLAELRTLGGNADPDRFRGLRTPRWRSELHDALQRRADATGRIALDFELVYGHAFKPPPRARVAAQTTLALEDLRAMARAGRRGGA